MVYFLSFLYFISPKDGPTFLIERHHLQWYSRSIQSARLSVRIGFPQPLALREYEAKIGT
jgi:hypothetical protein